ncbi:MAG: Cu2+-exporting ATPase [Myxococcota bacterium]|jgi:Cu2+-exporting ATPase
MTSNSASPAPVACRHCGTLVDSGPYCCGGCEAAAQILAGAGLDDWYEQRQGFAPRPMPLDGAWADVVLETGPDGCTARLAIDGLRCASCVSVTERLLQSQPGVSHAQVSYATGRAVVRWDPAQTDLGRIVHRIAAIGYRPRPLHAQVTIDRDLLMRLGVAAFCTLNLMTLTAAVYVGWAQGMDEGWADLFRWGTLLLASPVALWSAQPFLTGAVRGVAARTLHMDVPIALAVALLYGHGLWATVHHQDGYLDSLAMLVTLLLAGRLLEARSRRRVQDAVGALAAQLPSRARRIVGDAVEEVPPSALVEGDRVEVPSGAEIPADGVVLEGRSSVRMALLTGESEPRSVAPGDAVVAGGLCEGPPLRVLVTAVGERSLLGRMAAALEGSLEQDQRTDALASWFTGGTLLAAGLTTVLWWPHGVDRVLQHVVAVLVVACPCALALSRPLIGAAGLAAAARHGLLLRSIDGLLRLGEVREVALDKTGTITRGTLAVAAATDEALRIASGLERSSDHPVARAIVSEAIARGIPLPTGRDVVETVGVGIRGTVDGQMWTVRAGAPGVVLVEAGTVVHTVRLRDVPRDDAGAAIASLKATGLPVTVLTGDSEAIAQRVAAQVGVPAIAGLDPLEKAAWLRARSGPTLFVGDGLNDGPALSAAYVGLAMGSGASASILVADGVVARDGLGPVAAGLRIAAATQQAVRRSLGRSIAYNLVAVGAAMAGLVNPLVAAVLMPISSLLVVAEAARLERHT